MEAVRIFESTLAKHNKPVSGMAFGPPEAKKMLAKGRSVIVANADVMAIQSTVQELGQVRELFPAKDYSGVFQK